MSNKHKQIFYRKWCKSCGICASSCPKEVIKLDADGHPFAAASEDCIGCRFCELHCPDFAIEVLDEETSTR